MPAPTVQKKFGDQVRTARKALKLSGVELAAKVGVCYQAIHNIERGCNFPSMPVAIALCRELKLDVDLKSL